MTGYLTEPNMQTSKSISTERKVLLESMMVKNSDDASYLELQR